MKAPIHSTKHYVQFTEFSTASLTVTEQVHAHSVPVVDKNAPAEVEEGTLIKAVFVELWLVSNDTPNVGSFVVIYEKMESNATPPSLTEMTTLNNYNNKKNILFTSQGILGGETVANPTPVLRQWIKIPKGKQRMGLGDELRLNIAAIGASALSGCSFATYKEYS